MTSEPPLAPLYLHDLADLLHAHLLTHTPPESHYDHLRKIYDANAFSKLHTSYPRTLTQPIYVQHLFQAALTITPYLLNQLCCPAHTPVHTSVNLALLTLLYLSQPLPQQHIRITHESLQKLSDEASIDREAAQLVTFLFSKKAFCLVPQLVHSTAHAPNNLVANPFPPLLKYWRPSLLYGYHVPLHDGAAALSSDFVPACPYAREARRTLGEEAMPQE